MRILVLTSTFPRWAGDREPPFVFELCRRLARANEVMVLAPHCPGATVRERLAGNLTVRRFRYAPAFLESLAYEGGIPEKLRRAPWRYLLVPFFLAAEWWAAARALREVKPDVIHAHAVIPHGVVARLARGMRGPALVCTAHGSDLLGVQGLRAAKAWVARGAQAFTVVGTPMQPIAVGLGAKPSAVRVMPMGVDARERFVPQEGVRRSADELLFVGRLVPLKGASFLLRALTLVRRSSPGAHLTIVGAGPSEAELRAEARALGLESSVAFAGAVPNEELPRYYRSCALLVMPSVREGFGLVAAEALACGCPVVASDLPGIADIVEDGTTGLLAAPRDPDDLAKKILRLLLDARYAGELARKGREKVLRQFDWESVARGYEDLLRSVAV